MNQIVWGWGVYCQSGVLVHSQTLAGDIRKGVVAAVSQCFAILKIQRRLLQRFGLLRGIEDSKAVAKATWVVDDRVEFMEGGKSTGCKPRDELTAD
jgi:hypothetical protein